jgi:hypothetical protein
MLNAKMVRHHAVVRFHSRGSFLEATQHAVRWCVAGFVWLFNRAGTGNLLFLVFLTGWFRNGFDSLLG